MARAGTQRIFPSGFSAGLLLAAALTSGCASDGSGGGSDGPWTVSGPVLGLNLPPDGTRVDLIQIDSSGAAVRTVASSTTVGGRYSFDLNALGVDLSSDLVLWVVDGANGIPVRAFVVSYSVDITPASETAVRLVLERLAQAPGTPLSNFTVREADDLVASVALVTLVLGGMAGLDLDMVLAAIRNEALANADLVRFLDAAMGDGQTSEGPGDIGNFFPFNAGDVWRYRGSRSSGPSNYEASAAVGGTETVSGVRSHVFLTADSMHTGYTKNYRRKDSLGITFHGDNGPPDPVISSMVPFQEFRFPLKKGGSFLQVDQVEIDFGDLDGDFTSEIGVVDSRVTVEGFEDVNVTAGYFANAAKITTTSAVRVVSSATGESVTAESTASEWFVSEVGLVKVRVTLRVFGGLQEHSETREEELIGMVLNGRGQGERIPIAPGSMKATVGVRTTFALSEFTSYPGPAWFSTHPEVATIGANGDATAVGPGTAAIFGIQNGRISDPGFLLVVESRTVTLSSNDVVYSPLTGKLYASVASNAGLYPGTITAIDPHTGEVGPSLSVGNMESYYVGSGQLALSRDGRYLYVVLAQGASGGAMIRRVDLVQWSVGHEYRLESNGCAARIADLEVLPENPDAVVMTLEGWGCPPAFEAAGVYDYVLGAWRPNQLSGPFDRPPGPIVFSDSPGTLYGFGGNGFYRMAVDASGIRVVETGSGILIPVSGDLEYDGGRIYAQYDKVIDPVTWTVVGTLPDIPFRAIVRPDSRVGRTFVLVGSSTSGMDCMGDQCRLQVFDQATFDLLDTVTVAFGPSSGSVPTSGMKVLRWETDGLAILGPGSQLVLLRSPVVSGHGR